MRWGVPALTLIIAAHSPGCCGKWLVCQTVTAKYKISRARLVDWKSHTHMHTQAGTHTHTHTISSSSLVTCHWLSLSLSYSPGEVSFQIITYFLPVSFHTFSVAFCVSALTPHTRTHLQSALDGSVAITHVCISFIQKLSPTHPCLSLSPPPLSVSLSLSCTHKQMHIQSCTVGPGTVARWTYHQRPPQDSWMGSNVWFDWALHSHGTFPLCVHGALKVNHGDS